MNALTVDVEDYHNVFARDRLGRDFPPTEAVVRNTRRLLTIFAEHRVRGTFFTLGEVAATFPDLLREIADAGHELGVHGFYHRQVFKLTPETFRREVADAKVLIEQVTGQSVRGHRAPAFSIGPETRWGLDVLAQVGFEYDSSIFPIAGRRYGWPQCRPDIHRIDLADGRHLIEAPLSTVSVLAKRWPACGGGYLRHFPAQYTEWAIRRIQRHRPAIVYLHPYEIESPCPEPDLSALDRPAARRLARFHRLQLRNRHTVESKIVRLLRRFEFAPLHEVIDHTYAPPTD